MNDVAGLELAAVAVAESRRSEVITAQTVLGVPSRFARLRTRHTMTFAVSAAPEPDAMRSVSGGMVDVRTSVREQCCAAVGSVVGEQPRGYQAGSGGRAAAPQRRQRRVRVPEILAYLT